MDAAAQSSDQDGHTAYTTSKQVQAWFLRRSRDRWKKKYCDLRSQLKRLRQRVADTDASRTRWRRQAEDAAQQIEALQAQIARLRDATATGGKRSARFAFADDPSFQICPASHGYSCGVIGLFLSFVRSGISLRGTSRILALLADLFGFPFVAPHWTTSGRWPDRSQRLCHG